MNKIRFKIDNNLVEAIEGQTIFQAAKDNGIEIPHMCYDPRLPPFTSCWLCIVEVKGFPRLVPSCTAKAVEGMEVFTQSERIISARKTCLSLLLTDHYGDCIGPCQKACPDNIDIQGYLALIALGRYREALELIREVNPLPLCVGRVCPRFCERECRRNLVDEPVGINYLKRFATEIAYEGIDSSAAIPEDTGFKVAIVGAGPAGLTAAHFLRLKGHAVTIIEANGRAGGMMRYGIPAYRLPKKEMDKEIELILNMGARIIYGTKFGKDITLDDLLSQGFHAVLLAIGAWAERRMGCEGEDIDGVVSGIGLLYRIAAGEKVAVGERVSVIGGGNTAIDAARSCLRLGAKEVHLIYRRSRDEMPALDEEIHEAELEGVRFHFLSAPVMIKGDGKKVTAIKLIRMELGEPDASGRRRPIPVEGSEYEFKTDMVVAAIGQFMADQELLKNMGIHITRKGTISVDQNNMQTNLRGVFAAGDCVRGPATVIESIADGRHSAEGIDLYLAGAVKERIKEDFIKEAEKIPYNHSKGELESIDKAPFEAYEKMPRAGMPALSREERLKGFSEVDLGLSEEAAKEEALRCLSCGCDSVFDCKLREYATEYEIRMEDLPKGKSNQYLIRDEHAVIFRDRNKCIRCGLCARICAEIEGASAIGFINRGFQSIIDPPLDYILKESACDSCGLCLSACPTGALVYKPGLLKTGPWAPQTTETFCTLCGIACRILIKVRAGYLIEVMPKIEGSHNQGKLCWKGTFGWEMLNSPKRLRNPYKMQGKEMVCTAWDDALKGAGNLLNKVITAEGPQAIAIIVSPRLSNEEAYLISEFANTLGIKDLYSPGNGELISNLMAHTGFSDYSAILESDLILCLGSGIVDDYPVISYMIKDAVKKGCLLGIIGNENRKLTDISNTYIDCTPEQVDTILSLLSAIAIEQGILSMSMAQDENKDKIRPLNPNDREILAERVKRGDIKDIINNLIKAVRPVVIFNSELPFESTAAWLLEGIWKKADEKCPIRFIPLQRYGLPLPGTRENGYLPIEDLKENVKNGRTKALLAFGHWKGLEGIKGFNEELVIVQSSVFGFQNGYKPDFLFPASLSLESSGSFVNTEGRKINISEILHPPGGMRNWEFILALAKVMWRHLPFRNTGEVAGSIPEFPVGGATKAYIDIKKRKVIKRPAGLDWSEDEIDQYLKKEIKEEKL